MKIQKNALKHSCFVRLKAASPADSKQVLTIQYGLGKSPFGAFFLAATEEGFCRASFIFNNDLSPEFEYLKKRWLNASFQQDDAWAQQNIDQWFQLKAQVPQKPIQLHIVGTHFQLEVWQALLDIPLAQTISYSQLATQVGRPKAFRAVGTAVGANPITFLIPCHRVLQQNGEMGGYFWGLDLKRALIEWEAK